MVNFILFYTKHNKAFLFLFLNVRKTSDISSAQQQLRERRIGTVYAPIASQLLKSTLNVVRTNIINPEQQKNRKPLNASNLNNTKLPDNKQVCSLYAYATDFFF